MPDEFLTAIKSWPADRIERRLVNDLLPYARNARTHSAEQIAQIAASIEEFGFTNPVIVDEDGTIIAGHGRVLAAKKVGLLEVPCALAIGWSEAQRRAYVIADNKLALNAGWDEDLLRSELEALGAIGFETGLLGFGESELEDLFADPASEGDTYSKKLVPPIYTPSGKEWKASELLDDTKAKALRAEIKQAKLPKDVAQFLLAAADRHVVFDFHKIADFYAAAPAETQALMERSALVIVDFDKAIENGFVRLNDQLRDLASEMPNASLAE